MTGPTTPHPTPHPPKKKWPVVLRLLETVLWRSVSPYAKSALQLPWKSLICRIVSHWHYRGVFIGSCFEWIAKLKIILHTLDLLHFIAQRQDIFASLNSINRFFCFSRLVDVCLHLHCSLLPATCKVCVFSVYLFASSLFCSTFLFTFRFSLCLILPVFSATSAFIPESVVFTLSHPFVCFILRSQLQPLSSSASVLIVLQLHLTHQSSIVGLCAMSSHLYVTLRLFFRGFLMLAAAATSAFCFLF